MQFKLPRSTQLPDDISNPYTQVLQVFVTASYVKQLALFLSSQVAEAPDPLR